MKGLANFVLRIYSYKWRTEIEIEEELKLLILLKEKLLPVSFPVPDKNGDYIQRINSPEGERFAVLFSYADGKKLHQLSASTHQNIGVLVGRLHSLTNNLTLLRTKYTASILLEDSLKKLAEFLPADCEEMRFMQKTQVYLLERFSKLDAAKLRTGIVHLDIWFDNLNVSDTGEVTLFDFDFCGNGWLALDLAYYIMQVYNTSKYDAKDYQPKVAGFLAGYKSITAISAEEERLLPEFGLCLYFFYLGIQCERFDNWSNIFLNEDYLKRYINGIIKKYCQLTLLP